MESSSSLIGRKENLFKEKTQKEPAFFDEHQLEAEQVNCDRNPSTEEGNNLGFWRAGKGPSLLGSTEILEKLLNNILTNKTNL